MDNCDGETIMESVVCEGTGKRWNESMVLKEDGREAGG